MIVHEDIMFQFLFRYKIYIFLNSILLETLKIFDSFIQIIHLVIRIKSSEILIFDLLTLHF